VVVFLEVAGRGGRLVRDLRELGVEEVGFVELVKVDCASEEGTRWCWGVRLDWRKVVGRRQQWVCRNRGRRGRGLSLRWGKLVRRRRREREPADGIQ
jgi:hypothetical protein